MSGVIITPDLRDERKKERKKVFGKNKHPRRIEPPKPHRQHITTTPSPTHKPRPFRPLPVPLDHSSPPPSTHLRHPPQYHHQQKLIRASKWQKNRAVTTRTFMLPGDSQENFSRAVQKGLHMGPGQEVLLLQTYWERASYFELYS